MVAKQAYAIIKSKRPGVNVGKCHEYDSIFVFHLKPDMLRLSKNSAPMIDGLICVNKTTGEVRDFKPFYIPIEEYKRGKEVSESVYRG